MRFIVKKMSILSCPSRQSITPTSLSIHHDTRKQKRTMMLVSVGDPIRQTLQILVELLCCSVLILPIAESLDTWSLMCKHQLVITVHFQGHYMAWNNPDWLIKELPRAKRVWSVWQNQLRLSQLPNFSQGILLQPFRSCLRWRLPLNR